jgi:hypothetical protein
MAAGRRSEDGHLGSNLPVHVLAVSRARRRDPVRCSALDEFNVEGDSHLVADQYAAGFEGGVPG